jgi:hypothetical protein
MSYITPRVQIQQEFEQLPVYSQRALSAFIIGPHYHLARYNVDAEKYNTAPTLLDGVAVETGSTYQYTVDSPYDIPNVPLGGDVDPTYTKVFIENVLAQYFPNSELGITAGYDAVELVELYSGSGTSNLYYPNRVRFTNPAMKLTSVSDHPRVAALANRNVAVGDYIAVTGGTSTVRGRITEILPEVIASTIANATNGPSNVGAVSYSRTAPAYVASSGSNTGITPTNVSTGAAYYGYASKGIVTDTYTVTVTQPSEALDLTTCKFSISSANGAFVTKTEQSLAAGILILDDSTDGVGANSVKISFVGATGAFVEKSAWKVTVFAAVVPITSSTLVKSGTYTGPSDMVYSMVVARGGALYDGSTNADTCAQLIITGSALDTQTVVLPQKEGVFSIGSFGVSAKFTAGSLVNGLNNGLIKGDVYNIAVTSSKPGATKTVVVAETITTTAILTAKASLTAKLYLEQPVIQVPAVRSQLYQTKNWIQSGNQITIKSGITSYD